MPFMKVPIAEKTNTIIETSITIPITINTTAETFTSEEAAALEAAGNLSAISTLLAVLEEDSGVAASWRRLPNICQINPNIPRTNSAIAHPAFVLKSLPKELKANVNGLESYFGRVEFVVFFDIVILVYGYSIHQLFRYSEIFSLASAVEFVSIKSALSSCEPGKSRM